MRFAAEWAMVCGFADLLGWSCSLRLPRVPQSSFPTEKFPHAHGKPELSSRVTQHYAYYASPHGRVRPSVNKENQ